MGTSDRKYFLWWNRNRVIYLDQGYCMKLNRSLMITILMVVLAICAGILLNGCASIGDGKNAGEKPAASRRIENENAAVVETSESSAEVREEPIVNTGVSEKEAFVQEVSLKADETRLQHSAASLKEAIDHLLSTKLPEANWNRIATVLVGILIMSMIYGLAFALGRLPLRGQGAGRRGGGRQTREHAGASASR